MRINKKQRFVYVSTPKAGTHTIYRILNEHFSDGLLEAGFHNNRIVDHYDKYFRWTVVRNPFTRASSIWYSACRLAHLDQYKFRALSGAQNDFPKFTEWMLSVSENERQKQPLLQNQTEWLNPAQPLHIVHLERLEKELIQLPFWKDGIEISKLNTTAEKIVAQAEVEGEQIERLSLLELYADQKTIDNIIKWAEPDFDNFGYDDEWLKK